MIPIIPLECLWINQFYVNKCCSLADFDLQSPSGTNMLVYMFERKGNKVLYWTKSNLKKEKDRLRHFHIKSNTFFYANLLSHWGIFNVWPEVEQRPPPEPVSNIWSAESSLLTLCKKTSGFQDFSPPKSFLFSLSFDWCVANHSWKSLRLLSWIFPAWCNVLMILSVVCHVQWHQNKRNILPLKRWTSLSSQADHLCSTYHETLWIPQTGRSLLWRAWERLILSVLKFQAT